MIFSLLGLWCGISLNSVSKLSYSRACSFFLWIRFYTISGRTGQTTLLKLKIQHLPTLFTSVLLSTLQESLTQNKCSLILSQGHKNSSSPPNKHTTERLPSSLAMCPESSSCFSSPELQPTWFHLPMLWLRPYSQSEGKFNVRLTFHTSFISERRFLIHL